MDSTKFADTLKNNLDNARYVKQFGCNHLKVNLNNRPSNDRDMTVAEGADKPRILVIATSGLERFVPALGAMGAIRAASWVVGRKPALYTMRDVLGV